MPRLMPVLAEDVRDEVFQLTEEFVGVATATANYYARRIAKTLRLRSSEIPDLRQELLLEVLRRAGGYDTGRAAWTTFADMIVRHAAEDLATRLKAAARRDGGFLDDLSVEQRDGSRVPLVELLEETEGLSGLWSGALDPVADIERRVDLERFVEGLPGNLKRLCRLLQAESMADALRLSGWSPAMFYRQINELRMRLVARDLGRGTS